jgi:FkbM family methyltransferase
MFGQLKKVAKTILPRSVVAQYRHRRQVDEVTMLAAICTPGDGVMVDVGGHTGGATAQFVDLNWRVVAYEPDPVNRAAFVERFGHHPKVQLSEDAVSRTEGDEVTLYSSDVSTGISGLSAFHESHRPVGVVRTVRLDEDLKRRGVERVDVLKVDVEGFDYFVLQGFDWSLRPRMGVYEFEERKTRPLGYKLSDTSEFMMSKGYHILYSVWEPIESYGIEHTWRGLYRNSPKDHEECWGNVLFFDREVDREKVERLFSRR